MPIIEVDEAEVNQLRQLKALLDQAGANPKTRKKQLEIIKELRPDLSIPDVDLMNEGLEEVKKVDSKIEELKKSLDERDAKTAEEKARERVNGEIESGRKKLKAEGWQDEGIQALEKLMEERGIADYEAAAAYYEKTHPKDDMVLPTDFSTEWNFAQPAEDDESHKLLVRDPQSHKQWKAKEIQKFFAEKRAGAR